MKMKSPAVKKTPVGKQKTPNAPKSGKKSIGSTQSPKIGKTPPPAVLNKSNKKPTPAKKGGVPAMKGKKGAPKKRLEDLSESDVDSDEDFGLDGEEFGPLSDDSDSEADDGSPVQVPAKGKKGASKMEVDEEDDDDDEEGDDDEEESDEAPAVVSSKPAAGKKSPVKGEQPKAAKTNGQKSPSAAVDASKSVFIGNLTAGVTEDDVRKLFTGCGEIESVVLIKDARTNMTKGYGFVNFIDSKSLDAALKKDGVKLVGKPVKVARRSVKGANKTEPTPRDVDRSKGVYVGNMPFSMVTVENIKKLFADCGDIESVAINRNNTGQPRGSAVVNFTQSDSVQKALQKSGTQVEDRQIVVRLAADTSRTVSIDHIKSGKGGIFGVAKSLKDLLNDCDDIACLTLKKKADSDYAAFVEFESPDSAKKAIGKSGSQLGQGVVTVEMVDTAKQKTEQPVGQQQGQKRKFGGQGKQNTKKPFNKGGNNQKKPFQGAGSPGKSPQQPAQDKSAALKNKTKQKFEKKKEASKKKFNKQS